MSDKTRIRFLPGGLVLVTRGNEWVYLTCGEGEIVAAVMCRPTVTQPEMDEAMWPGWTALPATYRETRKSRLRNLNIKLRPFGVSVVTERVSGASFYSLHVPT